jgi:folate-binding protein YgfZ
MFSLEQYRALQEVAGFLDRHARGRLVLTGADRRSYLHGQLTNDIEALSAGDGCYAALLTPQGRMISDMRVSELGDRVLLDLPAHTADTVRQRLTDLIFSEDVEVADARDTLTHLGLYGPAAAAILGRVVTLPVSDTGGVNDEAAARTERLAGLTPGGNERWLFQGVDLFVVASRDYGVSGLELFVDAGGGQALAAALGASGAMPISAATADVTRVEGGVPEFGVDMDEHTIPLEAGIEDRAISLTKGCYVGQEVIIRVLHRGQGRVARKLVGFVGDPAATPFAAGEALAAGDGGKAVGSITSAVVSPRLRRPIGLGYVHRDHAAPGSVLHPGTASGAAHVTVVTLPFTAPAVE